MTSAPAPVDAVLLAAGAGSRMALAPTKAASKLTLPFGMSTVVGSSLRALLDADVFRHVVVVTGHTAEEVERAARLVVGPGEAVTFAVNPRYHEGMAGSIGTGVRALDSDQGRVAIALGDLPLIRPETLRALVETFRASSPDAVVRPTYGGVPGHPVLFGPALRRTLAGAPEAAQVLAQQARSTEVKDAGVTLDVDTPSGYASARARAGRGAD